MENIPEITLDLKTTKVGEYNVEDMILMFGDRITPAIYCDNENRKGIIMKEMQKILEKEENIDIKEAYKNYFGYLLAPYIMMNEPPVILCDSYALNDLIIPLKSRYTVSSFKIK
jgi:hypothetical protein